MKTLSIRMLIVIMALTVCLAPVALAANTGTGDSSGSDVGLGVASFLCSLPYGAFKFAVAVLGGVVGGFTYPFDQQAADTVWYTTIGGDYLITPDILRGKKNLHFTGEPPASSQNGADKK